MHERARPKVGKMAIAIAFPGFNDLGRSVTPVFLLMDNSLHRFSTLNKKNEETISTRSFNFLQNAPSPSFFLAVHLSVRRF